MHANPQRFTPGVPVPGDHSECGPDCVITGDLCDGTHANEDPATTPDRVECGWFHRRYVTATKMVLHPFCGYVPTCDGCIDLLDLDGVDLDPALLGRNADGSDSPSTIQGRSAVEYYLNKGAVR